MSDHVISGLITKRAEIAGQVEGAQDRLRLLLIDLDSIDSTLRIFHPDIELDEIRPKPMPPRHAAFKGQVTRALLEMLREAKGPLTSQQMAQRIMAERELNTADRRLVTIIGKRVGAALRNMRDRQLVRSLAGRNSMLLWEMAGRAPV